MNWLKFFVRPVRESFRPDYPPWEDYQAAMKRAEAFHVEHKGNEPMTKYAEGEPIDEKGATVPFSTPFIESVMDTAEQAATYSEAVKRRRVELKEQPPWDALPPMPTFEQAAAERKIAADAQLRDQFATEAVRALISNGCLISELGRYAYDIADAMMKERNRVT